MAHSLTQLIGLSAYPVLQPLRTNPIFFEILWVLGIRTCTLGLKKSPSTAGPGVSYLVDFSCGWFLSIVALLSVLQLQSSLSRALLLWPATPQGRVEPFRLLPVGPRPMENLQPLPVSPSTSYQPHPDCHCCSYRFPPSGRSLASCLLGVCLSRVALICWVLSCL